MSAVVLIGDGFRATLWPADGNPRFLDDNDVLFEVAKGINSAGQVVGKGRCSELGPTIISGYACISEGGRARALGSLGNYHGRSYASAINDRGESVGWSEADSTGWQHAALWRNDSVIDLGTLGGTQSEALDIAEGGRVVGWARPAAGGGRHAFLWESDSMVDLGTLGGEESIAHGINESGHIVGWVGDIGGKRAFVWQNGVMSPLPGGSEFSEAFGINNNGEIVGTYITTGPSGSGFRAALWRDGERHDLTDLVGDNRFTLIWASAINDAGQIAGVGTGRGNSHQFAFRLTPR